MRFVLTATLSLFLLQNTYGQSDEPIVPKGYHVVLGAFAVRDNASAFHKQVVAQGKKASMRYLPSRNLYYVYLDLENNVAVCLNEVKVVRQDPQYADAWVKYVNDESGVKITAPTVAVEKKTESPNPEPVAVTEQPKQEVIQEVVAETVETVEEEAPSEPIKFYSLAEMTLENMDAFISLYNAANDRVVSGKVQVVDTERGRLITSVEGNSYLKLPDPKSKSGRLSLICNSFGYRQIQQEINFSQPLTDSTASFIDHMGTSLIIKFPLIRYQKGDIQALYNVYFYNDAAIFLPESKFELNELLFMMQENKNYRIRLHGHTNGNYHGKIIEVGDSKNFFAVTDDSKTVIGSARELSEARAEVIKDYLVANGIEESRMEVKAWGGKKPIYDKHSANAKKNIRVEVEIINE